MKGCNIFRGQLHKLNIFKNNQVAPARVPFVCKTRVLDGETLLEVGSSKGKKQQDDEMIRSN